MSQKKTLPMRPFILICGCVVILLTDSCGKDTLDSPIVGAWKQVSYSNDARFLPTPPVIQPTILTLRNDRTFDSRTGSTIIQEGTFRIGHTSNPPQDVLYLSDDQYGSRISFSKDTLTLTYLGFNTWTSPITKYVRN